MKKRGKPKQEPLRQEAETGMSCVMSLQRPSDPLMSYLPSPTHETEEKWCLRRVAPSFQLLSHKCLSNEVSLSTFSVCSYLKHHARLLQQIRPHVGADDAVATVEADLDVFPKTAAVVVACRLCIPDSLCDTW